MNGFHHFENGDRKLPDSLNVLPETSQVQNISSQIRNKRYWIIIINSYYSIRNYNKYLY